MCVSEGIDETGTAIGASEGKDNHDRGGIWEVFELLEIFRCRIACGIELELDGALPACGRGRRIRQSALLEEWLEELGSPAGAQDEEINVLCCTAAHLFVGGDRKRDGRRSGAKAGKQR